METLIVFSLVARRPALGKKRGLDPHAACNPSGIAGEVGCRFVQLVMDSDEPGRG
jgi:hypothetical protein